MVKVVIILSVLSCALSSAQQTTEPRQQGEPIPIIRYENEGVNADGSYQWNYETGNGIKAEEKGQLKNAGTDNEAAEVQGSYSYTAPDGTSISITYLANEDGFQPQGDHIPTPPPIPLAIQRALEWIQAHPEESEESTRTDASLNARTSRNSNFNAHNRL